MADYFAVLSRTLAGFGEPKPELRAKLYERARMTIRRQLDNHTPPLDDAALNAEMTKLEDAIGKVESSFGPPNVDLAAATSRVAPPKDAEEQPAKPDENEKAELVEKEDAVQSEKAAEPDTEPVEEETKTPPVKEKKSRWRKKSKDKGKEKATEAVETKAKAAPEKSEPQKTESDTKPSSGETAKSAKADTPSKPDNDKAPSTGTDKSSTAKLDSDDKAKDEPVFDKGKEVGVAQAGKPVHLPVFEPEATPVADTSEKVPKAEAKDESVDPMDEWAREFLNAQEASKPEVAEALAEIKAENPDADATNKKNVDERAADIAAAATAAAAASSKPKPAPDLPVFGPTQDETITIPPVPSEKSEEKSGGTLKWVLFGLIALLLAAGAALAFNWENRSQIASSLGLDGLFGDSVEPRPVKTIKITPDPEPEPEPEPEQQTETPTPQPEPETPKSEDRLTGEGQTEQPATPAPEAPAPEAPATTVDPAAPPEQDGADENQGAQTDETQQQASNEIPAAEAGTTPAVAQSAILYEEGSSASQNSFDTGRVVWSVVEEQGGEGEGMIPAIRGRVEVPSRQLVLIMTIKRNTDRALPASHLIELVFAVPDDFSGGSVGEISRFVLKENEQGRGDALIGVPARIADGIFLIALNNLESAQKTNVQLLRGRSWIDIPMAYRTGRRALITLEKGVPGEAVFKEVFDAWDQLDNKP